MIKKQYAKLLHLGVGVHSFGNASTILAKPGRITLLITDVGVLATHHEFKKKAMIPFANIKAFEIDFNSDYMEDFVVEEIPTIDKSEPPVTRVIGRPAVKGK